MYPILFDLGFWQLRSYGVFVALAVLVGAALASLVILRRSVWRVQQPAAG